MKSLLLVLTFLFSLSKISAGQKQMEVEGVILDRETKAPVPFVNIYNKSTGKGTISNENGYFRISIGSPGDTVTLRCIGYQEQRIAISIEKSYYRIFLARNSRNLSEVTIRPTDNSFLYKLVHDCKKSASNLPSSAKGYYELKSFVGEKQLELVENYYNLELRGYRLVNLNPKAGRIALRPFGDRMFTSTESSKAILMMNLFDKSEYFPLNPLALGKSAMQRDYYLQLEGKYLDEGNDSIYIIDYQPKDSSGLFFSGKLWVNKTRGHLLKITLNCESTFRHPFRPLWSAKSISDVGFFITQSFQSSGEKIVFKHCDFTYKISYAGRVTYGQNSDFTVLGKAILYAYDYEHLFNLPLFNFNNPSLTDYRKISAMPYNDFFWSYQDEYRTNDSANANEVFFRDSASITNPRLFKVGAFLETGLFLNPHIFWSGNRIILRDVLTDSSASTSAGPTRSEQFNLAVKIYFDWNQYRDSTHILTATIMDPFESFYYLPVDNKTNCFINIYFDLCEIERRRLEEKLLDSRISFQHAKEVYRDFLVDLEAVCTQYLKAVERGTNLKEMSYYNQVVREKLGIDNMALFSVK